MLTNFKINRDSLNRMNGKSETEMQSALRDWMDLADEQHRLFKSFYDMDEVLTLEDIPRISNAKMIVEQIYHHMAELQHFFALVPAGAVLTKNVETLTRSMHEINKMDKHLAKFMPNRPAS